VPIRDETERDCAVCKISLGDMKELNWFMTTNGKNLDKWQKSYVSGVSYQGISGTDKSDFQLSDWFVFVITIIIIIIIIIISFISLMFRVGIKLGLSLEVQQYLEGF